MANETNEKDFEPLFIAVAKMDLTVEERTGVTENYMFMYRDGGDFAYKHYWTRRYVYLNDLGVVQSGEIEFTGEAQKTPPPLLG